METEYWAYTFLGIILIICGVVLITLPLIARSLNNIEKLPWIIVWIYRSDDFYFATSPILIIVSVLSIVVRMLKRP